MSGLGAALLLAAGAGASRGCAAGGWLPCQTPARCAVPELGAACAVGERGSRVPPRCVAGRLLSLLVKGTHRFFGEGYACKPAPGIGLVSFRYLLRSQGVLPTSSGKIVLPTGSLFTLPLSWTPGRDG